MISSDVRSPMNTKQGGNYIYRERDNCLINKSACAFRNMSRVCLRQWCRINRTIKRNNELKGETIRKKRKERKNKKGNRRKGRGGVGKEKRVEKEEETSWRIIRK